MILDTVRISVSHF